MASPVRAASRDQHSAGNGLPGQLLELAAAQCSALTGSQVRAALGERRLRGALRSGDIVKLWHGAYAVPRNPRRDGLVPRATAVLSAAEPIPVATRLTAAELTLGRPVTACLDTAAELHGFSTHRDPDTHVLGAARSTLGALKVHRMPPIRPLQQRRFAVVDPAETAVRLAAAAANPPRALAVLDAALRSAGISTGALAAVATELHLARIGLVRTLVDIADPRAESPPESWLRWVCHDAGFPPPNPQFWVQCGNERWFRLDLAWPGIRLGLEYDGVEFHTGRALTNDRARLNALAAEGWTVLSVTAPMVWSGREALVRQIGHELRRRGLFGGRT